MPWDFWLIFLVLGVVIPWRGRVRLRHLLAQPACGTKEKLVLYGSTIAFQWILMGVVAWRAFARGLTPRNLGWRVPSRRSCYCWAWWERGFLGAFQWFNLRRVSRMTGAVPEFMRKLAERLLPGEPRGVRAVLRTGGYRRSVRGVSVSRVCHGGPESRGTRSMGRRDYHIASLWFGAYLSRQKRDCGNDFHGAWYLARFALFSQSLSPVVVWHSAVDLVAGIAGPRYLRARQQKYSKCFRIKKLQDVYFNDNRCE